MAGLLLVAGCNNAPQSIHPRVIRVSNQSSISIYPELHSNNIKERFGVVGPTFSKTHGFGPFSPNEIILVRCIEDDGRKILKSTIDCSLLLSLDGKVDMLNFIYQGDNTWILKVFDEDHNELIAINGVKYNRPTE